MELPALTPVIPSISTAGGVGVIYYNMASYGSMLMTIATPVVGNPTLPCRLRTNRNQTERRGSVPSCFSEIFTPSTAAAVLFFGQLFVCSTLPPCHSTVRYANYKATASEKDSVAACGSLPSLPN